MKASTCMGMGIAVLANVLAGSVIAAPAAAANHLVKSGEARSRIVVADDAPRMTRLAAEELRHYLERMTGADVPVGDAPDGEGEISIHVGRNSYTDALGVTDEGLDYGAYRMVSGPGHLILLGHDRDYTPLDLTQEGWLDLTGADWRNPVQERGQFNSELGIWSFDEGGSLNAVYAFLHRLGVRWYMPGELGTIVPEISCIALPEVNETVHPDFAVRHWIWAGNRFASASRDRALFDRRVGAGARYEVLGNTQLTHGIRNVHASARMQAAHPEYFALIGTERDTTSHRTGHACFSSAGLEAEVVAYARAVFDQVGVRLVQLSPQDGFRQCECADCRDMSPSDNVFGFLNRVAASVRETHPDRIILAAGYGAYRQPPENIDALSPNLAVTINNLGRPRFVDDRAWDAYRDLVARWKAKVGPQRILRVENTRYGANPIPAIHPRSIARDLASMRGISLGERNELRDNRDLPASTHLNLYVMGRFYWDAGQDIEALLTEYYRLFYGPAADLIRTAFDFAEQHPLGRSDPFAVQGWFDTQVDILTNQVAFWEMVQVARVAAGDTVYGERVALLLSEAPKSVDALRAELETLQREGDPRANAVTAIARRAPLGDDALPRYFMVDRVTGETPPVETSFTLVWEDDALIVDVHCQEPDIDNLQTSASVMLGDNVAILLETPYHAHYHLEINPEGDLYDRAWGTSEAENWSSLAVIETSVEPDGWRVRARIPIMNIAEGQGDPLHFVVGGQPSEAQPWYFNIGRVRIHQGQRQTFLFSPTGGGNFHQPARFARLIVE